MSQFKTLFKFELKKQFPTFRKNKKEFVGSFLSFIITMFIILVFVAITTIISENYIGVRLNKVSLPYERAYELLNLFYLISLTILSIITLENMRKTLADKTDKQIMLKLPIKEQTLFLSKMVVLLLKTYILASLIVIPINAIVYFALAPKALFWLTSSIAFLIFPIIAFLVAGIFIVPYIKFINFIKNKYALIFIALTLLFVGGVVVYVGFLKLVQSYLETGYIKFIFNEKLVLTLQSLTKWTYPSNSLVGIVLNKYLLRSSLVLVGCCVLSAIVVYFTTKRLFHITLYRNETQKRSRVKAKYKKHSINFALLKKEFITIVREPKHILSFLVIPTIMPILTYCCYTLLESLIANMLGIQVSMVLALFIIVTFSILTNTFCATNVTREGYVFLKQKTFPIKAKQILNVKVLFCSIVSVASIIASCCVLIFATSLTVWDGLLCVLVGGMFTIAQIFLATKMDLKNSKTTLAFKQVEKLNSTTIVKVICVGAIISLITGFATFGVGIMAQTGIVFKENVGLLFSYLIPVLFGFVYMSFAMWFYFYKMQQTLDNLSL